MWNLLHVTLLTPIILKCLLDFCTPALGNTLLQNISNCLPTDMASHSRRLEASWMPPWEPHAYQQVCSKFNFDILRKAKKRSITYEAGHILLTECSFYSNISLYSLIALEWSKMMLASLRLWSKIGDSLTDEYLTNHTLIIFCIKKLYDIQCVKHKIIYILVSAEYSYGSLVMSKCNLITWLYTHEILFIAIHAWPSMSA